MADRQYRYVTRYGRTVVPSHKARENELVRRLESEIPASSQAGELRQRLIQPGPRRYPSDTRSVVSPQREPVSEPVVSPRPASLNLTLELVSQHNSIHSDHRTQKSEVNVDIERQRIILEQRRKALEIETDFRLLELQESVERSNLDEQRSQIVHSERTDKWLQEQEKLKSTVFPRFARTEPVRRKLASDLDHSLTEYNFNRGIHTQKIESKVQPVDKGRAFEISQNISPIDGGCGFEIPERIPTKLQYRDQRNLEIRKPIHEIRKFEDPPEPSNHEAHLESIPESRESFGETASIHENRAISRTALNSRAPEFRKAGDASQRHDRSETANISSKFVPSDFEHTLDWIGMIDTPEEQKAIKLRLEAQGGQLIIPLILSTMQDFIVQPFSGHPIDWPEWAMDFKVKVHDCLAISKDQKVTLFKKSLSDEPRRLVYAMLLDYRHYKSALLELRRHYGSRDVVARAHVERFVNLDQLKDSTGIIEFRAEVGRIIFNFSIMNLQNDLQGHTLLTALIAKLSRGMKESYGNYVRKYGPASVGLMYEWLGTKEESLRLGGGLTYGTSKSDSKGKYDNKPHFNKRSLNTVPVGTVPNPPPPSDTVPAPSRDLSSNTTGAGNYSTGNPSGPKPPPTPKCSFCQKAHWLSDCSDFLKWSSQDKLEWFKKEQRCFRCCRKSHRSAGCTTRVRCATCNGRHQIFLHDALDRSKKSESSAEVKVGGHTTIRKDQNVFLMMLPVRLFSASGLSVDTKCMLDPGSQGCFLSKRLCKALQLKGKSVNLKVSNVAEDLEPINSRQIFNQVHVCDPRDSRKSAILIPELFEFHDNFNLPSQILPRDTEGRPIWDHVNDLDIPDIHGGEIGLLLGVTCKDALCELEIRKGPSHLPDAVKLAGGWCLRGAAVEGHLLSDSTVDVPLNHCQLSLEIDDEPSLNQLVEQFWTTDSFGCKFTDMKELSVNDRYALDTLRKSIKLLPIGHYEVAMLWMPDFVSLPDNTSQSVSRYHSLRRSLMKNPEMKERYCSAMNRNIEKGYARRLSESEVAKKGPKTHTISHHGVYNASKQKMRPVFDAAEKFLGTSLNVNVVSGPDMTNNAEAVKLRFRKGAIPMSADVEDMFYRVRARDQDIDALRFVWDPDLGSNPSIYVKLVHIFGARSSPTCANFALRQCALDNQGKFSENAINAILCSFYVDDFLCSVDTEQEAVQITRDVIAILASGGFHLTKWVSPCKSVLDAATSNEGIVSSVNLDLDDSPVSRVLGVHWSVKEDMFYFRSRQPTRPLTKRGILGEICSVYDP